jgi:hypothetical protein
MVADLNPKLSIFLTDPLGDGRSTYIWIEKVMDSK